MKQLMLILAIAALGQDAPSSLQRTVAYPFFSVSEGFGFVVECRNSSDRVISSPSASAIRIDGVEQRPPDIYMGATSEIKPGDSWQELVTIGASTRTTKSAGYRSRRHINTQLQAGRHRISFSCGLPASEEIVFYVADLR
jgi:hypothetical protein